MKKLLFIFVSIIFIIPISVNAISTTASSAILMDMDSGRILYKKDVHNPRLVASITKIMTAVLAIENGNLDDEVTVGEEVLTMYGSNIYIELGEKMTLRDLLYGLLLRSGNDAAIVIGTYIGGSEEKFVEMMNKKAKEIGMINTTYHNCHGLDEVTKNYSTAYDMAVLSSYANTLDVYREISKTKKWVTNTNNKSYVWHNRNKLLTQYEYATGGKTGYTPKAGRTLVTTASKDNLNLTAVTLYDPNEYVSHKEMYEYGFNKLMASIATYIRGECDPIYPDVVDKANDFYNEYTNLIDEYDNLVLSPDNQKNMTNNSIELAKRFKIFVESIINKLLNKELYFTTPPITKDNALTDINYFIYNLEENKQEN